MYHLILDLFTFPLLSHHTNQDNSLMFSMLKFPAGLNSVLRACSDRASAEAFLGRVILL